MIYLLLNKIMNIKWIKDKIIIHNNKINNRNNNNIHNNNNFHNNNGPNLLNKCNKT